ncbi:MAG: glycosyltransferase [Methylococcaceae bacterium]|jgi:hopene-associated glycosyltransferase HpnB
MQEVVFYLTVTAAAIWLGTLLLPWRPWSVSEVLEAVPVLAAEVDLSEVTVVIPARNEAEVIAGTLASLREQGKNLKVILVDDDSSDATIALANGSNIPHLSIIESKQLPEGWSGKLWAQEQGLKQVATQYTLLLDADIALLPGMINSLKTKLESEQLQFVSLMAVLRFDSIWEKLLMPAFIFFFKMMYPFALSNSSRHKVAAAAGGCIFAKTSVLCEVGAMVSIKNAVIDDCSLAKAVKSAGFKTWVGLTHGVLSQRRYEKLANIWDMVARTAFTQLNYSLLGLVSCSVIMLLMYWMPFLSLFIWPHALGIVGALSIAIMFGLYLPVLRFYSLNPAWGLALLLISGLFLLMTWSSALRYWKGERSRWKGRIYQKI